MCVCVLLGLSLFLFLSLSPSLLIPCSECNTAGMLSGKAGVVSCHLQRGERPFDILRDVLRQSGLPLRSFLPTQVEGPGVEDGVQWIADGGFIDFAGVSDAVLKVSAGVACVWGKGMGLVVES